MATADSQTIYVKAGESSVREGILHFTQFSSTDRVGRAFKILGLCWLGALITLFIPLAHFILTPGFLIAGVVMAYSRYMANSANESVQVACPACGKEVTIQLEPGDRFPLYTYCPSCHGGVQLTEK
ncbi:MAG: hypothetical protein FD130_1159 [Halothiobacillaceae bacterium]|nr:MAG: hypothetical protein FD130_1159 [Halothiobacillaceae bacterium]